MVAAAAAVAAAAGDDVKVVSMDDGVMVLSAV